MFILHHSISIKYFILCIQETVARGRRYTPSDKGKVRGTTKRIFKMELVVCRKKKKAEKICKTKERVENAAMIASFRTDSRLSLNFNDPT